MERLMTEPLALSVRELVKDFRGELSLRRRRALDGATFELKRGEILGLLGPNGAGKSTTFKCLIGLLRPDSGSLEVLGGAPGTRANSKLGFLPEQPVFYDYLSARELMDWVGRLHGLGAAQRERRGRELLERVGLREAEHQRLRGYSKGMLQRLGLAQALLNQPELLILDEPMSSLDPVGRHFVRDLILDLRARGVSVLFSSHVLSDAELLCDRVAILIRGRVRREGTMRELAPPAAGGYEVALAGAALDQRAAELGALLRVSGAEALVRAEDETALAKLLLRAPQLNLTVRAIRPLRRSLEDTFLEEIRRAEADG
jgi:ABC-2 type transport system ATP-binding protein